MSDRRWIIVLQATGDGPPAEVRVRHCLKLAGRLFGLRASWPQQAEKVSDAVSNTIDDEYQRLEAFARGGGRPVFIARRVGTGQWECRQPDDDSHRWFAETLDQVLAHCDDADVQEIRFFKE